MSSTETGWLRRADDALGGGALDPKDRRYLEDTFLSSRDRLSTLAATVAGVGTVVLALLAVAVTLSANVETEETKAETERAEVDTLECERKVKAARAAGRSKKAEKRKALCADLAHAIALAEAARAEARRDEVRRLSTTQLVTGGLLLGGFLAALASQLINPIPPPPTVSQFAAWRAIRDRYRQKRRWIELALVLYGLGVAVLVLFGLGVLA